MSAAPPQPRTPVRVAVCLDADAADTVERELCAAGVRVAVLDDATPGDPRAAGAGQQACRVRLLGAEDTATAVEQLLLGVWVVAHVDDPSTASDLYDQGRRLGIAEWFDRVHRPVTEGLSEDQLRLLLQIRRGADIERAARVVHLSPRTAARRLNDARHVMRARSTAEAVARVGRRIDELSV